MTEMTWEKSPAPEKNKIEEKLKRRKSERLKFIIGGLLILGAVGYLIFSSTLNGASYFKMVDEVVNDANLVGHSIRLTGAVLGDTIDYDAPTGTLSFIVVHIPSDYDNLAETLHEAVIDPTRTQLVVQMEDTTMPDLLQHEAQAILTGEIGADGIFYGTELNLKCPTRFEEHTPEQLVNQE